MQSSYTIIIPVFNEIKHINHLLNELRSYYKKGHEIIIIDDGSDDGSYEALLKQSFITLFRFNTNRGKGEAIKKGISESKNEKIILFDADFELHPKDIRKLMVLDFQNGINVFFGNRFNISKPKFYWDFGNIFFTKLFNFIHKSSINDALCCAKSFYLNRFRC